MMHDDLGSGLGGDLVPRKSHSGEGAHVDMTAMIDLVFMLNIFFLVTSLVTALGEIEMPRAKHVVPVDPEKSVVLTVVPGNGPNPWVYMGDMKSSKPFPDADQDQLIAAAVEDEVKKGKNNVIIKAEKGIAAREIKRIARAATVDEGTKLFLGVTEKDD